MRLTKLNRETFIKRAMQDVPKVDYDDQLRSELQKAVIAGCPREVQALYKVDPSYLRSATCYTFGPGIECRGLLTSYYDADGKGLVPIIGEAAFKKLKAINVKRIAQDKARNSLEETLEGAVTAYTTRKALAAALPEFEKYLPAEEVKGSNLPALANVVTDFMAAGWPKGKEQAPA